MTDDEIIALADSLKNADGVACIVHEVPCEMHRTTFLTYEQIDVIGTALKMMVGGYESVAEEVSRASTVSE